MSKRFGIRITLPKDSTLQMSHLLGTAWESFRWFNNQSDRDDAFEQMRQQPANYRDSDMISQCLEKVEQTL